MENQREQLTILYICFCNNIKILELEKVRRFIHNSSRVKPKLPALSSPSHNKNFKDVKTMNVEARNIQQNSSSTNQTTQNKTSAGAIMGLPPGMEIPRSPFLPEKDYDEKEYTLVLDLDETLIHFVDMGVDSYFLIRPGAHYFLEEMNKYYEIVVFTAGMKDYADWVLDQLDINNIIKHRLYRHHVRQNGVYLIKDLGKIGRNLQKNFDCKLLDNYTPITDSGV